MSSAPIEDRWHERYAELRSQAERCLSRERKDHTLSPTELVHEVYLRLRSDLAILEDRALFFFAATQAMRRILVEYARRRGRKKRGLGAPVQHDVLLDRLPGPVTVDWTELDRALQALEVESPEHAQVLLLHYFGGLTTAQIAETLNLSQRTVQYRLQAAVQWVQAYLDGRLGGGPKLGGS